jgi:hypothetical protein
MNLRPLLVIGCLSLLAVSAQAQLPFSIHPPIPVSEFSLDRVPSPLDHLRPTVIQGGPNLLVTWTSWFGPYEQGSFATVLDPSGGALRQVPFTLPFITSTTAAWNGEEFLIAGGLAQSRFDTFPAPNLGLIRYSQTGAPLGEEAQLGHSACSFPSAQSVLWNKERWLVAWNACGSSFVAALDRSLSVTSGPIAVTGDALRLFEGPGGEPYLFRSGANGTSIGRLTPQLAITDEHSTSESMTLPSLVVARNRVSIAQGGSSLTTAVYDFAGNWSVHHTSLAAVGVAIVDNGDSVDVFASQPERLVRLQLNADATTGIVADLPLAGWTIDSMSIAGAASGGRLVYSLTFGSSPGPLFHGGSSPSTEVYSAPLTSLSRDTLLHGDLLSAVWVGGQSAPTAVATANGFLLLWDQYVPEEKASRTFALPLDRQGTKAGLPTELPFLASGLGRSAAWNGTRVLLVWSDAQQNVRGALLDAQGHPDGEPFAIGSGIEPVAASDGHDFLTAWEHRDSRRIRGTPISAAGLPAVPGGFTLLETGTPQWNAALVWNGATFVGVWFQAWDEFHFLAPTVEMTTAGTAFHAGLAGDLILTHGASDWPNRAVGNLRLDRVGNSIVAAWNENTRSGGQDKEPVYLSVLDLHGDSIHPGFPIGEKFLTSEDWSSFELTPYGEDQLLLAGTSSLALFEVDGDRRLTLLAAEPLSSAVTAAAALGTTAIHLNVETQTAPEGLGTTSRVQYRLLSPELRRRVMRP